MTCFSSSTVLDLGLCNLEFSLWTVFQTLYTTVCYNALQQVFDKCALADVLCQNVNNQLKRLFEFMSMKEKSSLHVHRYNLNQQRKQLDLIKLNSVYLVCVIHCTEYHLSCSHTLCNSCVKRFDKDCVSAEYEYTVSECFLYKMLTVLKIRIKSSTFTVYLLSINDERVFSIISAEMLILMQKKLSLNLSLHSLFDYFIETSSDLNLNQFLK